METFTPNSEDIKSAIRTILAYIGEDPDREGLIDTPDRIIRMWREIFRGYDPEKHPAITTFANDMQTTDIIFDRGNYYSCCEHHMMPFFGRYYFAYIPKKTGRIIGISKISRVVNYCAARLQLQERLAADIINMLSESLDNYHNGMALVMKGTHLCKTMRGTRSEGEMTVAHLTGLFQEDDKVRREFYKLIDMQNG